MADVNVKRVGVGTPERPADFTERPCLLPPGDGYPRRTPPVALVQAATMSATRLLA